MAMDKEIKEHRTSFIVFSVLRVLVLAAIVLLSGIIGKEKKNPV